MRSALLVACALIVSVSWTNAARAADELQPSWQCLPEETVFVLRVPAGRRFVDAFREQTKLGALLLSSERFEGIVKLIQEQAGEGLSEFTTGLAKYNLKIEDFPRLFDQEVGFALVLEPRRDQYPLLVGLTWAEPEKELCDRLLAAISQVVDEGKDEPGAPQRVDFAIDGHSVMHLSMPVVGPETIPTLDAEELDDLDEEQIKARIAEHRRQLDAAKVIPLDQTHFFITRIGNRLLIANTFALSEAESRRQLAENPQAQLDLSAISGLEQAKGIFARYLAAHVGPPSGLTPRLMSTPGLAAALPDGVPAVEVLFSIDPLLKWASGADDQSAIRVLKNLGLDRVGPGALRVSLHDEALRMGLFVAAAEPRQGLLALLDQSSFVADPPTWVPANVLGFGQLSFDLGKAYVLLRDVLIREAGDQIQTMVDQLEQQIRAVTQNDVATLLSSVGQNHYFVSFPNTLPQIPTGEGEEMKVPESRQGFVWQLKDEAPWKRLIQLGAGFAALTEGAVTAAEEQGFVGLRMNIENTFSGGVFVGHGYMVLGMGPDVLEPLMSALRNPPEGAAALRGGDLQRRANQMLPPEPAIYYQISDFDQYLKTFRQTIASIFDISAAMQVQQATGGDAEGDVDGKLVERIKQLIPTDQELEGTAGVSVGQVIVNQHGLIYRGAVELPR